LLLILFALFSCSDDEEIAVEGVIEATIDGEFIRFDFSEHRSDNFYHLGMFARSESDRIELRRCEAVEESARCINIEIRNSALDDQPMPFSIGSLGQAKGTVLFREDIKRYRGETDKNISLTILSKADDILEGTFSGTLLESEGRSVPVENGRFRIKIFRYEENVEVDTCEMITSGTSAALRPIGIPPLFNGIIGGDSVKWISDGCNFRFFRNAFFNGPYGYEVGFTNEKGVSPTTRSLLVRPQGPSESFDQDSILAQHEPGIKNIAFDLEENGFAVELILPVEQFEQNHDPRIRGIIFTTQGVIQPEDAFFEILSRTGEQRLEGGSLPWFDYRARLNLRLRERDGVREIDIQGEIFIRALFI